MNRNVPAVVDLDEVRQAGGARGARRRRGGGRAFRLALIVGACALLLGSCGCAAAPPPKPKPPVTKPKPPASGSARACFKALNDIGYGPFWGIYSGPVNVDAWLDGQASQVATVETGTNGCINMALVAGYSYRFRVYSYQSNRYWVGNSDWLLVRSGGSYNFGNVIVEII